MAEATYSEPDSIDDVGDHHGDDTVDDMAAKAFKSAGLETGPSF